MDTEIKRDIRTEKEVEFLEKLYKNVKMGSESLLSLMPKVKDQALRSDMTLQLGKYEGYATKLTKMLFDLGAEAKEENIVTKAGAKIGITMNTLMDSSTSHIAQMVSEGSNMGIDETLKNLREYENQPVSEKALALARDMISFEERNVEIMRGYI